MILRATRLGKLTRRAQVKIWVDGKVSFKRILRLIARAKHTVVIQTFIWKDDTTGRRIAAGLLAAADRGVHIDISKEATGDVFELGQNFIQTRHEDTNLWKRFWSHPNISIHHIQEDNHAKSYIIDGEILLLTGMNIADEYAYEWHDFLIELRGSRFVDHYLTGGDIPNPTESVKLVINSAQKKEIRGTVRTLLSSATHTIVLVQAYLSDPDVLDLLIQKSKDGVRIVIILPSKPDIHHNANIQSINELLTKGDRKRLKIFLSNRMVHGKVILVDKTHLFIGSANLITSSLDQMGEANVYLTGKWERPFRKIREAVRKDILESVPVQTPPSLWLWGKLKAMLGL